MDRKFFWSSWQSPVLPWRGRAIWERDKAAQELQGKGTEPLSLVLALNSKFIARKLQDSILSVGHTETWKLQQCPAVSNTAFWMLINSSPPKDSFSISSRFFSNRNQRAEIKWNQTHEKGKNWVGKKKYKPGCCAYAAYLSFCSLGQIEHLCSSSFGSPGSQNSPPLMILLNSKVYSAISILPRWWWQKIVGSGSMSSTHTNPLSQAVIVQR